MRCSVIVANYNNSAFIKQALQSIEQQTYRNWEAVVVDDCSTDNSLAIVDTYLATVADKTNYKLIRLLKNEGVGNAKRVGVKECTGELVFILDADDALTPTALEELTAAHVQYPAASLIYSTHYNCDADLNPIEVEPTIKQVQFSDLLEDSISHLASFKRRFYDLTTGIDPYFKLAVDKDIYYKLEEVGDVVFVNKPLYFYRISKSGISQGFDNYIRSRDYKLAAIENAIKRREKSGVKLPDKYKLRKLLAEIHLLQAEGLVYSRQSLGKKLLKHLGLAILYNPLGSIKRKLKAAFMLSRLKRAVLRK
ncbi:glycosyltransferase family 2 protein [Pontibacter sp. KCTC 32443]|uniref:glycosyltransferase family 2 protein n=1 Tax=Pontibacter TaxID=323449 RepID=UPI00164E76C5|nr:MULTISPECIES: glycosyltransferase family 2 protein [Pontibacter]MBC5775154.1 glycosyltransferase family 2 protein [Pontibacter sp. KCTC 32443]